MSSASLNPKNHDLARPDYMLSRLLLVLGAPRILRLITVLCSCLALSPQTIAQTKLLSIHQLTASADVVVVGKVASIAAQWNDAGTQIFTRIEIEPEEVLKGTVPTKRLLFVQPGGRVGRVGGVAGDTPSYAIEERVVVFLVQRRNGQLGVIGAFQGIFTIAEDLTSGREIAVRRAPRTAQIVDQMPLEQLRSEVQATLGRW